MKQTDYVPSVYCMKCAREAQEVKINIENPETKVRIVASMHLAGIYAPASIQIDEAANFVLLTGERGRLKHLIKAMALEGNSPVELEPFPVEADLVTVEVDSYDVTEYIAIYDESALPEELS